MTKIILICLIYGEFRIESQTRKEGGASMIVPRGRGVRGAATAISRAPVTPARFTARNPE